MNEQTTETQPTLSTSELRDADQILADLQDLSHRLSRLAPKNLAFYAVNRAWRNMGDACEDLRKATGQ